MENLAVFMTWWVINFWRPSIYLWRIVAEEWFWIVDVEKKRKKEKGGE